MLLRDATELPERFLDSFSERLKGFAEADADRFHVRIGQDKVIHQVRECFPSNGHAQIFHMREIGLGSFTRGMPLFKDDFLRFAMQRFPLGDMSLQSAHLRRTIALWMLFTQ